MQRECVGKAKPGLDWVGGSLLKRRESECGKGRRPDWPGRAPSAPPSRCALSTLCYQGARRPSFLAGLLH